VAAGGVALFAPVATAVAADARVRAVHVTQSVQTVIGNDVPLVADRSTAVRAVVDEVGGDVTGVFARAHITVDGVRVTPFDGIPPINQPFTPVAAPSLDVEEQTLNFELLAPTGLAPRDDQFVSNNVTVRVDISVADDDASNNSMTVSGLRVESKQNPSIRYRRLQYLPYSTTAQANSYYIASGRGDAYLRQAFPVNDSEQFYTSLDDATYDVTLPCAEDVTPCTADPSKLDAAANDGPPEGDQRLGELEMERMVLAGGSAAPDNLFLYEWLPNGSLASGYAGLGSTENQVAYGIDRPRRGQSTFAHELGHNYGVVDGGPDSHNASDLMLSEVVGWDVGGRLVGNPAENEVVGRLKTTSFLDRWNPDNNGSTATAWIRRENYLTVLNAMPRTRSRLFGNRVNAPSRRRRNCLFNRALIFGYVSKYHPDVLRPVAITDIQTYRAPWCSSYSLNRPISSSRRAKIAVGPGHMTAQVTLRHGSRTRRVTLPVDARLLANTHDLDPPETPRGRGVSLGPFVIPVGVPGDVQSLIIRDHRGKTVLKRTASTRRLAVVITSPRPGARVAGRTTLRWGLHSAASRSKARFVAAYSPNAGRSWLPLGVGLRGSRLKFDADRLPPSTNGRIRVVATDGLASDASTISRLRVGR
jgi:hypothetical protein